MQIKGYYTVESRRQDGDDVIFDVSLNPDCSVYDGHFPGEPISPGVCNLQMIRECAEQVAGCPLMITCVTMCRFVNLVTPALVPHLSIRIHLDRTETEYSLSSSVCHEDTEYISFKAKLSV